MRRSTERRVAEVAEKGLEKGAAAGVQVRVVGGLDLGIW